MPGDPVTLGVDDPEAKAGLLRRQLAQFQPDGDHATVAVDQPTYGRMLTGIRGLRLEVTDVPAKFKYDDHKPVEHRSTVAERLTERGQGLDVPTARQQLRRLDRPGPHRPLELLTVPARRTPKRHPCPPSASPPPSPEPSPIP
ncbi:hypothetical protein ACWGLF_05595 [Streptomyces puniciscabiei]